MPAAIAQGVYWLPVGRGLMRSNVYFVRAGSAWALIDTGSQGCAAAIVEAASALFGSDTPPEAILLTHSHVDHAGSARELTRIWSCPLYSPGNFVQGRPRASTGALLLTMVSSPNCPAPL